MQPVRSVACPRCGAAALFAPENRWRPFCSERCKLIDLGAWASEAYRVPDEKTGSGQDIPTDSANEEDS